MTTHDVYPSVVRYQSEKTFKSKGESEKFPFLDEKSSIKLSVVVPAYNEETRCELLMD